MAECAGGGSDACLQQRTLLTAAPPGAGMRRSAKRGHKGAAAGGSSCSGIPTACFQQMDPPVVVGRATDRFGELTEQSDLAECGSTCSGRSVACRQQVAPAVVAGSRAPLTAGPCPIHRSEERFCLPVPGPEYAYLKCGSEPLPLPAKAASALACRIRLQHGQDDNAPGCSAGCTAIDPNPDPGCLATANGEGRPAGSDHLQAEPAESETLGTLTQPAGPPRSSPGMRVRGNVGETLGASIPHAEPRCTSPGSQEERAPGTWADLACALRDSSSSCTSSDAGAACGTAGSEPAPMQLASPARGHSALGDSRCSTRSTGAAGRDHAACLEPARLQSVGPTKMHARLRRSRTPLRRTAHEPNDEPQWAQGQGQIQGQVQGQGQGRSALQVRSCSLGTGGAQNPELASGQEAGSLPSGLQAPAGAEAESECPYPGPCPRRA